MHKQKLRIFVDSSSQLSYSRPTQPYDDEIMGVRRLIDASGFYGWISFSKTVEFHNCVIMLDYEPVYFDFFTNENITKKVLRCIENNTFIYKKG